MASEDKIGLDDLAVSAETLAVWLKMSVRTLKEHAASGRVVKAPRGYFLKASVQAFTEYQREKAAGRGGAEMQDARKRVDIARAKLLETKAAAAAGETVPVSEVLRTWSENFKTLSSQMMAIPNRMGMLFGHLTRLELNALEAEIRTALNRVADGQG